MEFVGDEGNRKAVALEPRARFAALAALFLVVAPACRSLEITPAALRAPGGRTAERAAALARWEEALVLINEFLESPYRRTLPPGRFELTDQGMRFHSTAGRTWTIGVYASGWGDLVVATGFRAQEASDGFCVGAIEHEPGAVLDGQLDHTFFRSSDGIWHDSFSLAEVTLHETTHVVYRAGTIGPWNTMLYYAVAIATLSAAHHPAEDRPRATSEEFAWFGAARSSDPEYRYVIERVRDAHLAAPHEHCEHGPFAVPLELVASIPLPGVEGRIDHLALDEAHGRLFVAARNHGTLEVVDLAEKKVRKRAEGLREPQGVLYLSERDEVWISQGGGGVLDVYRGETLELVERIRLGPDGDNLRFDAETQQVWLGYASGALAWLDAKERKALGRVQLPAHPEAFALERKGPRVFANVPGERGVWVFDRARQEQVGFWPIEAAQANYPMLLLQDAKELFLGCRSPGKLVVLDSDTGKQRQALELSGDVDDLWLDVARGRIYASCGEGTLDVFARKAPKEPWERVAVVPSAKGARTSCFSEARKQLFLAVPKSDEKPAEIRVYETRD